MRQDVKELPAKAKEELGLQYLEVRYVTIEGAGGSSRVWSYELVAWLQGRPGTLIVGLRAI